MLHSQGGILPGGFQVITPNLCQHSFKVRIILVEGLEWTFFGGVT